MASKLDRLRLTKRRSRSTTLSCIGPLRVDIVDFRDVSRGINAYRIPKARVNSILGILQLPLLNAPQNVPHVPEVTRRLRAPLPSRA